MNLSDLDILPEYRSFEQNIVKDFYIPTLKRAVSYKRAVGYFSSSSLVQMTQGLLGLIENKGKMKLIASPFLSKDDIEAIEKGYKNREEIIEGSLNDFFSDENNNESDLLKKERQNLLAWLIKKNILEIKLAIVNNGTTVGMYHEKIGIISDGENKIAFSGSMNETGAAISYNYESFDVFTSWEDGQKRVDMKEGAFDRLWNNEMNKVDTYLFPEALKERLIEEAVEPDFDLLQKHEVSEEASESSQEELKEYVLPKRYPRLPEFLKEGVRDYQQEAIDAWEEAGYRGIFSMATGTGKTITGLAAATRLYQENERLALIIVAPYQHLVEQWVEDIRNFNMSPIIGYSSSVQRNWKSRLKTAVRNYRSEVSDHFCFVTTNATFSSSYVQAELGKLNSDFLLLIDEAHNFGAPHLQKALLKNALYRLALSATIERHQDEQGTQALYDYFGEKVIDYTLEDAIEAKMLTPYYYYPIVVSLREDEIEKYREYTARIVKSLKTDRFGRTSLSESAKMLLIMRARIIAGAQNKLTALSEQMKELKDDSNMLVYCGATTVSDEGYVEGNPDGEEIRQIEAVTDILGNHHQMKVAQFTSKETIQEREEIKESFAKGEDLQALVAIRCLDEGVDIPKVQTAFLLASSTNPKEYIQRRGRVLRLADGKDYAVIYDFITLPVEREELGYLSEEDKNSFRGLVNRELIRMRDFSKVALNSSEADGLIFELEDAFNLYEGAIQNNDEFV